MRRIRTPAVVLRRTEYSETSQVGVFLTRDVGRVSAIAKGIRRLKSSLKGPLDLASVARVGLLMKSGRSLHTVTHYDTSEPLRGLRRRLSTVLGAEHVVELVLQTTAEEQPDPELFDLVLAALRTLDRMGREAEPGCEPEVGPVLLAYEARLLRLGGWLPEFDECADCGAPLDRDRAPVAVSHRSGGPLCADCARGVPDLPHLDPPAVGWIGGVARSFPARAERLRVAPDTARRAGTALRALWRGLLGRDPRTLRVLGDDRGARPRARIRRPA